MKESYEGLAECFDELGWGKFAENIFPSLRNIIEEKGLKVRKHLDIACGTGTLALLFAETGASVTGLDGSKSMLREARKKDSGDRIRWVRDDIRDFSLDEQFDLITCTYDSINHLLYGPDWLKTFANVKRHLHAGGLFFFDVNTPAGLRNWDSVELTQRENFTRINRGFYNIDSRVAVMKIEIFKHSRGRMYKRISDLFYEIAFPPENVKDMLQNAGFDKVEQVMSDDCANCTRAFFIAR